MLFYLDSCSVCVLAAVLLPRAMAMVLGSDTTDTQAFVSHFPRALQDSQELYICQGTKQAVTGLREKALEQRRALRGQDVIVCFNRFWRNTHDTAECSFGSQIAASDSGMRAVVF